MSLKLEKAFKLPSVEADVNKIILNLVNRYKKEIISHTCDLGKSWCVCVYVCKEGLLICCNLPPEGVTMLQHPCTLVCISGWIRLSLHPFYSLHSFSYLTARFFIIILVFTYPPLSFPSPLPAAPFRSPSSRP